jgi:hypothetical protein
MLPHTIALTGITCTSNPNTCQKKARSIAYYDGYLYIGTGFLSGNSPELHIYCVTEGTCDPESPTFVSSLNVNHNINDMVVREQTAYLATSAEYGELTLIDVSNKSSPQLPPNYTTAALNNRKFDAPNISGANEEDGWSMYVLGRYAYLGREKVSHQDEREFYLLDISNPTNITVVGSMNTGINSNGAKISGIMAKGNVAFLSTTDANQSFFVINIGNPSQPVRTLCGEVNTAQSATGLAFQDNRAFIVHGQGSSLLKIIYDKGNACTL